MVRAYRKSMHVVVVQPTAARDNDLVQAETRCIQCHEHYQCSAMLCTTNIHDISLHSAHGRSRQQWRCVVEKTEAMLLALLGALLIASVPVDILHQIRPEHH